MKITVNQAAAIDKTPEAIVTCRYIATNNRQQMCPDGKTPSTSPLQSPPRERRKRKRRKLDRGVIMTKLIAISALAVALSIGAAAEANAWTRSGSFTGPRGATSSSGSGSCANGSCSAQRGGTGPKGNSWSHSGSGSCSGGTCSWGGQATGPRGNSYNYSASVSR